jgi:FkbM family methyltransferase
MTTRNVNSSFGIFQVELTGDFYGNSFWDKIENGSYEPDTLNSLKFFVNSKTDFIDVGVANGAMSIISALLGARVLGYEAMPGICSVANRNIELNDMTPSVNIRNRAISNRGGVMLLASESDPSVLSSIVFSGLEDYETEIQMESLADAVDEFHISERNLVIKIDIEGAEWKLLSDPDTIQSLKKHGAVVLLAIHPGFHRPFRSLPFGLTVLSRNYWHLRNAIECYRVFKSLDANGKVLRTNFDSVRTPKRVIALMFGGCHEFIVDFR